MATFQAEKDRKLTTVGRKHHNYAHRIEVFFRIGVFLDPGFHIKNALYVGFLVNFYVDFCNNIEILSRNIDLTIISMYSKYCHTLYFIFYAVPPRWEKRFSDGRNVNRILF